MKFKSETILIPIVLVVLNFIIKGLYLASNSIGSDEPFSIYHAQLDVSAIIELLLTGNNPPLYEVMLHYWINLFGISELSVRFPSLIFSCITVLFIYKLGRKHLNFKIALCSAVIFIFSNYHILFAHEARVYAFLGMLSVMSMYYFLNLIVSQNNSTQIQTSSIRNSYFMLLLVNVLLMYSHYFAFFILIVQFSFILFSRKLLLQYWKQLIISTGILAVLYSPNIIVLFRQLTDSSTNGTWVQPPNGIDGLYNMLRIFSNAPIVAVLVLLVCISALVKYMIEKKEKASPPAFKLIIFWFVFIFFCMFGISYVVPMFLDRYLMPVAASFSILIGISSCYLVKKERVEYVIPIVLCILFIVTVKPNITNKRNVKETVAKINEIRGENTLVLMCPANFTLNYSYYHDKGIFQKVDRPCNYKQLTKALQSENIHAINNINDIDIKKWNHIIYLDAAASFTHPNNNILNTLNKDYKQESKHKFYEIFNVYEYHLKP